jgi:dephospho-CoA kinase
MPFPDEIAPVVLIQDFERWQIDFVLLSLTLESLDFDPSRVIDHVGSTSVPGLWAKDVIDVQVRVPKLESESTKKAFASIGFRHRPESWNNLERSRTGPESKLVFAPPEGSRHSNIHVRSADSTGARDTLLFRDYLRANETVRNEWGEFKKSIVDGAAQIDLVSYGQNKQLGWFALMKNADAWAIREDWSTPNR